MLHVYLLSKSTFLLNYGSFQSLLILLLLCLATAEETKPGKKSYWYSHDYPNPQTEPERCGRSSDNPSWLCDPDNFISEENAKKLDKLINSVYSETRCNCYTCITNSHGYLIMVALMEAMYRDESQLNGTKPIQELYHDARTFAANLMKNWGGKSSCKEYVFILFSRSDSVLYTLAQENAKLLLNNTMIKKVNRNVFRYFSYKEGIVKGLTKMITYYKDIFLRKFKDPGTQESLIKNRLTYSQVQDTKSHANSRFPRSSLLFNTLFNLSLCTFLLTYTDIVFI